MISDRAQNLHESCTLIEDKLPEGWIGITLDQTLQALESGSRPKGGVIGIKEGVPSIGGEHINESGGFRFDTIKFVPHNFFKQMNHGQIQTGDILIVKDGATTGKVALAREDFPYNPAVVNEHVFICRPEEGIHPPFLFYFLFSKEGQDRILENFRGSAQGGINHSFAPGTTVPLAPLAEQKRIVAKLEELLARVNATKEPLAKVSMILKRFRQSVLAAACSGRLTADWREINDNDESGSQLLTRIQEERQESQCNKGSYQRTSLKAISLANTDLPEMPDQWVWAPLNELLHYTRPASYGVLQPGGDLSNGVPMVRVCDIQNGTILLDQLKKIAKEIDTQYARTRLRGGEVLVTLVGTIGRTAVVPDEAAGTNVARAVAMLPFCTHVLPKFIHYTLSEPSKNAELVELAREVARKTLNLGLLKAVRIPLAPLTEQYEIVRRVEAMFKLADVVEKRVVAAKGRSGKLTRAILAKAFRGELVSTEAELARREGRSYESASELLARIKSERETKLTSQKARRNRN
jgi:type I restriction enzyme S subunit